MLFEKGWAIHTAANGDHLVEVISGTLNLLTGCRYATMTYVGATGRFTDASGTAVFSLQLLAAALSNAGIVRLCYQPCLRYHRPNAG